MLKYVGISVLLFLCLNLVYATTCKNTDTGDGTICMSDQPSQSDMVASAGSGSAPATADEKYNSTKNQDASTIAK